MKEAISAGFNKFMSKPISTDELEECLSILQWGYILYFQDVITSPNYFSKITCKKVP